MKVSGSNTVALVGDETLLGRELKEVLEARSIPVSVHGFAANAEGNFAERDGETVFVHALEPASLQGERAIVVAGTEDGASKALAAFREGVPGGILIDCSGFLESERGAILTAPLLEEPKAVSGGIFVLAHPVSVALALALSRLAKYRAIRRAVAQVVEPASERGKRGLTELHGQTTNLLAFRQLDKDVFDAQLAFAMLPRYGEDAPLALATVEERVDRNLTALLKRTVNGDRIPPPSLRVFQAPVFHGYSISLWVDFESEPGGIRVDEVEEALASAQIEVRRASEEAPNNAAVASQSGLIAGDVRIDRKQSSAVWIWIAFDNLRVTADGAVDLLRAAFEQPVTKGQRA